MRIKCQRKVVVTVNLVVPAVRPGGFDLQDGATLVAAFENGRLVVKASERPHYTMAELLAQSDRSHPQEPADTAYAPAVEGEPA